MTPEEMVSRLLYRRGPNGGDSLEDHFDALRFGLPRSPALAHRLDRDTSGCLVLGRHRKALAQLGKLFKHGAVEKTYWAVVEGAPEADEGVIDLALGRRDVTRGWWMRPDPKGQPAVTRWKVMGRSRFTSRCSGEVGPPQGRMGAGAAAATAHRDASPTRAGDTSCSGEGKKLAWLALEPVTGRTHQLRVHCAEMGWPILGDAIYGSAPRAGGLILHLHSHEIVVPLYKNRAPVRVTAPPPPHMRAALAQCGFQEERGAR
jgi:tRNA pseudouridine32 synthase / 23S rRNA pseudouridine746 synthase